MRNRLTIFVAALLLLPPVGLSLSGQDWDAPAPIAGELWLPALLATLAVAAFAILLDMLTFRRTGHSLLQAQRSYVLWNGAAGAVTGLLLAYLNLFAGSWFTPSASATASLLLATLCGAALLPAVLITRLWLAGLPGLVRLGTRRLAFPALPAETAAILLSLAAIAGLLGGAVWIEQLAWLFWMSPLLLLAALQLLWDESTIFSGLPQGDWSRMLLGSASGIAVGGMALAAYRWSGGAIHFTANTWQLLCGFALFGLLCLQVGDIVAENWRGKKQPGAPKKKPFPIPIVTQKKEK